jgi:hypothetical protein
MFSRDLCALFIASRAFLLLILSSANYRWAAARTLPFGSAGQPLREFPGQEPIRNRIRSPRNLSNGVSQDYLSLLRSVYFVSFLAFRKGRSLHIRQLFAAAFVATSAAAQQPAQPSVQPSPASALTIYNENFAVARSTIDLDLHPGLNEVSTNQVTTQLEPDSVVLRDLAAGGPSAKPAFRIVEQNYDAAVVTQDWLLKKFEGKTIQFAISNLPPGDGHTVVTSTVDGKIVRAPRGVIQDGPRVDPDQPLIEVNGRLQFQLPGLPLFPASTDGLLLKPTLRWQIDSPKAQKLTAELAYITGGMNWEATYNVITSSSGDNTAASSSEEKADLVGWVTITNNTGVDFPQARIKLMAGDVAKIQPRNYDRLEPRVMEMAGRYIDGSDQVTQKAFDDYHLYDLNRTVSLEDGETKQVQFLEAAAVSVNRSYLYDGAAIDRQPIANYGGRFIQDQNYGLNSSNTKVQVLQEIKNSEANNLGIPLPAGRIRLYRRDVDGQIEFIGESTINHTPAEDSVKVTSGNAFDIKGSRTQTNFYIDNGRRTLDEYFEIKLANQKSQPVTVNVLEHLYRGDNWEIMQKSADYTKLDSHTIQFPVQVPAKGEASVTYAVRYTW